MLDEGVLSETLRELFKRQRPEPARAPRRRQPAHGAAHARAAADHRSQGARRGRALQGSGRSADAAEQRRARLSSARRLRHPEGPRQRVVLVAAQRDMVQRLLAAVRDAGLRPEGVDLSAFALIRSLYRPDPEHAGRVLYLNVDGLTNMAIAEGTACRFTRVVGGGMEAMASELAERRSIPLVEARELIAAVDLTALPDPEPVAQAAVAEAETELEQDERFVVRPGDDEPVVRPKTRGPRLTGGQIRATLSGGAPDADVRTVLENGIREIAGEVRNSLDFHRSQEGGGEVSLVVLSGAALDLPGFAEALQDQLGVPVRARVCAPGRLGSRWGFRPPPYDRRRPGRRGGAPMRAFNLIPADERGGAAIETGSPVAGRLSCSACSACWPCSRCSTGAPAVRSPARALR